MGANSEKDSDNNDRGSWDGDKEEEWVKKGI